ncbi:hypothetical protein ANCDUO_02420 [Ancylostoma duodenale]|uniref:Uncharacterized protein n=1 Tax=Ancylostoma duodenale TaxID=51022 RepID=A0A0C2HCH1_9BILA|nr:hypothetical protein ANCDUO_02420 [Ancylostoma duodenale]
MYGVNVEKTQGLETLPEIDTPKTSNYNFLPSPEKSRPPSRTSTHKAQNTEIPPKASRKYATKRPGLSTFLLHPVPV